MKALIFKIHLVEPVLINQLGGGDPNSAIGFDFIPGSSLRGAIIGKYLKGNPVDANDKDFQRLFLNGAVRFLNSYPLTKTHERALPTPVSWHKDKDDEQQVFEFAIKKVDESKTWKGLTDPFCFSWEVDENNYQTELYKPEKQIKIHTARADRQKVTEGESTIFRYEALDSGLDFSGAILADDESDLKIIEALLPNGASVNIGKSHLSGYGNVKIEDVMINEWQEYQKIGDDDQNCIIVTLLSDAIIRDSSTGAYITEIDSAIGEKAKKVFMRTRIIGGFNRTWNLPIQQTIAIQAGSAFVYDDNSKLREHLSKLEPIGIGERLAEGFGRFAIDWNKMEKIEIGSLASSPPKPVTLSSESEALAKIMVNRMMQTKLDQMLIEKINTLKIKNQQPKNSQLNSMRIIARRALRLKNPKKIFDYLDGMKKTASSQFQGATIEGHPLSEWIKIIIQQDLFEVLSMNRDKLPSISNVKPELKEDTALEYKIRLIDGVLNRALKEANNE